MKREINKLELHHPVSRLPRTFSQKAADSIAKLMGSWFFIISFIILITIWIFINSYIYLQYSKGNSFDPYPFILLNLVLSCIAAIQALIILMSQNRTNERDRARAEYDYAVNRKSEKEIEEIKQHIIRIEKAIMKK